MAGENTLPLPVFTSKLTGQAALASAAEASVTTNPPGTIGSFPTAGFVAACVQVVAEANVQYVVQCSSISAAHLGFKVKNVGSANGSNAWTLHVIYIDPGTVPI